MLKNLYVPPTYVGPSKLTIESTNPALKYTQSQRATTEREID